MSHPFFAVLFLYPTQNLTATVIVKVDVNIGHGDSIRIQKTLEQQVIFQRVDIGNTQTIGNHRTGSRSSSGTDSDSHSTGSIDEILHNQEVTGEAHGFHHVQFKVDTLGSFFAQLFAITFHSTFHGQFPQVVGFQFYTDNFFITTQSVETITKFLAKHLLVELLPICILRSKILRNREHRHHWLRIYVIKFNLAGYFNRVFKCFGNITEDFPHLFWCFKILLFGIAHPGWIIQIFTGTQTNESFMPFAMIFIYKMDIVGCENFRVGFSCQVNQICILTFLFFIYRSISIGFIRFVKLQFNIEIIPENFFIPKYGFFCSCQIAFLHLFMNFTSQTGRRCNNSLAVFFENLMINSGTVIKTFHPSQRNQFTEVLISFFVLCQQY